MSVAKLTSTGARKIKFYKRLPSTSSPSSKEIDERQRQLLREVTDAHHRNATVSLLSSETWGSILEIRQALRTIAHWNVRDSDWAFELLDKAVSTPRSTPGGPPLVSHALLRATLCQWKLEYSRRESSQRKDPIEVMEKLRSYRNSLPDEDIPFYEHLQHMIHSTKTKLNNSQLLVRLRKLAGAEEGKSWPLREQIHEGLWKRTGVKEQQSSKRYQSSHAYEAQEVLDTMWLLAHERESLRPNYETYEIAMRAWLRQRPAMVPLLLRDMESKHNTRFHDQLAPSRIHYQLTLAAFARDGRAAAADELFGKLVRHYEATQSSDTKPTGKLCATVMSAYANALPQLADAPERAEALYEEALRRYENDSDPNWLPTGPFYVSFITIWSKSEREDAMSQAKKVVDDYIAKDPLGLPLSREHISALIRGYCNAGLPDEADRYLTQMVTYSEQGRKDMEPDARLILRLTDAWRLSGKPQAEKEIQSLLVLANRFLNEKKKTNEGAEAEMMRILGSGERDGDSERAEALMCAAVQSRKDGCSSFQPSSTHYNSLIRIWSNKRSVHGAHRAESLLREMIALSADNVHCRPSEQTFTAVMRGWSSSKDALSGHKAQAVFDLMLSEMEAGYVDGDSRPSNLSYSALVHAWARTGDASRAAHSLQLMYEAFVQGNTEARPNRLVFNTVIAAWAKSKRKDAFEQAGRVFELMEELGTADANLRPDVYSYSTMLSVCAKSGDDNKYERASLYFDDMMSSYSDGVVDCKPNCMAYGSMVHVLSKCPLSDEVVDKALECLSDMTLLEELDAKQVLMAYTSVFVMIRRHMKNSGVDSVVFEQARGLYRRLRDLAMQNPDLRPNSRVMTALLGYLAHQNTSTKRETLPALLEDMDTFQVEMDVVLERAVRSCRI